MWLKSCLEGHSTCTAQSLGPPKLPKRVLDLQNFSDSRKVRLIESDGRQGIYVCLTYCWGGNNFMTTRANLKARMEDIPWDILPQTYKDSIKVVSALGIQFLWIDALCIVQQDTDNADWKEQSAQMFSIYGNACVSIAAANCSSAGEGFLHKRRPFEDPLVFCRFPASSLSETEPFVVFGRESINHDSVINDWSSSRWDLSGENPLRKRGWCFQEHVISERILHFGSEEMLFQCRNGFQCECNSAPEQFFNWSPSFVNKKGPWSIDNINNEWMDMASRYSGSKVTVPSDRLPALSGIATLFQQKTGYTYLAGHWMDSGLISSLAWRSRSHPRSIRVSERWPKNVCPSWSWASVNPIFYFERQLDILSQNRIISTSCCLDSEDITGAVQRCSLIIKGVFLNVQICSSDCPHIGFDKIGPWPANPPTRCRVLVSRNDVEVYFDLDASNEDEINAMVHRNRFDLLVLGTEPGRG